MIPGQPRAEGFRGVCGQRALRKGMCHNRRTPALQDAAQARRQAQGASGHDTQPRLLHDHRSDGSASAPGPVAPTRARAARKAAMVARGKAVPAARWPMPQRQNALHAATLSPDLPAGFEPTAARMPAALASAGNLSDNGGERTAP
jgi:hypothetical protein